MDDTKSTPSEMVAMMMLIRYYSASCLQLIDKIIAKLPPKEAFPEAFPEAVGSQDTAPPPPSSAPPVASSSPPASPPAPAPTPPPAPPPAPPPTPQQPAAELVGTIPNAASLEYPAVRHRLTVAAQAGHSAEVKALLTKYGATKLSEVDPAQYQTLLQEVEMLLKGQEVDGDA